MVDIGVTEEVVRNAICLASTTFNVSKWIEVPGDGVQIHRQRSNEMHPPSEQLRGSTPTSPRQMQPPVMEIKETPIQQQQQQSAVS